MRDEYDFSEAVKNPFAERLKQQESSVFIKTNVMTYFEDMSKNLGIPCQTLINMYLTDCMNSGRKLNISWE